MSFKTELYVLVSRKGDIHDFTLGTRDQSIRLSDDVQCSIVSFISSAGELQHDLVYVVVLDRDHRKNDASGFLHIGLNDVLYQLDIGSRLLLRFGVNESGQVHDGQVRPIGTRDFNTKEVL